MTSLFLAPATRSGPAYNHFKKTVLNDVPYDLIKKHSKDDSNSTRLWGLVSTIKPSWETVDQGDWVLFYTEPNHYGYAAKVVGKEHNPELGESIRGDILEDGSDQDKDWTYLLYLDNPISVSVTGKSISRLFEYKNDYPVRFIRVTQNRLNSLQEEYNSVDGFIKHITDESSSEGIY